MPSDLDYFQESALHSSNVRDFRGSLPDHLREIFDNSLHADILWANVLGGYRGPANMQSSCSNDSGILPPSHGLTEIKFWWRLRKWISVLTLGSAALAQKLLGHTEWSSLYFDSRTGECLSHDKNEAAQKLNEKADQMFERGNYTGAAEYYAHAYYNCNSSSQRQIYQSNRRKAHDELHAIKLCSRADRLFESERYSEASCVYQQACDKSNLTKLKNIYGRQKDQVDIIINTLSKLDTLWKEAWDAENDYRNDEAKQMFQAILSESKNCLNTYRNDSTLRQYKRLATLKIKGNELFNRALQSQQNGNIFFEAAGELKQQGNYESAKLKLEEAKNYFRAASEQFEKGSKIDQRFSSCVDYVQEQIDDVVRKMESNDKSYERYKKSARMCNMDINIAETNRADLNSLDFHENEKLCDYVQQI